MRPNHFGQSKASAERVVKDIRRSTRRHFDAEDKIRIVLEGLRGEDSIAELCRKEGIAQQCKREQQACTVKDVFDSRQEGVFEKAFL